MGSSGDGNQYQFSGIIAENRIYERALTPSEVADFSNNIDISETDLAGRWVLNNESGTITDLSGNGNDATIYGPLTSFTGEGFDGFVKIWFDQSGNTNDASQMTSTEQPIIIQNGDLVVENTNKSINWISGNFLDTSAGLFDVDSLSSFIALTHGGDNERILDTRGTGSSGTVQGWQIKVDGLNLQDLTLFDSGDGGSRTISTIADANLSGQAIRSTIFTGTTLEDWNNQISVYSDTGSNIDTKNGNALRIGANLNGNDIQQFTGKIQEILIYPSDKTTLRTTIEASINNYYNIYNGSYSFDLNLNLASNGTAIFEDNSYFGIGTISTSGTSSIGTITFQDNSYAEDLDVHADNLNIDTDNTNQGTLDIKSNNTNITIDAIYSSTTLTLSGSNPDLTLNGTSTLNTITADDIDITLNNSSYIGEFNLTGNNTDITFNTDYYHGSSTPDGGELIINGNRSLKGTSANYGSSELKFYDSDNDEITQITFNASSTNEFENLNIYSEFNDNSINNNIIRANAEFFNLSSNTSSIYGNVTVNSPVARPLGGTVFGNITHQGYDGKYFNNADSDGDWNNPNNWWTNSDFDVSASAPSSFDDVFIYGDLTTPTIVALEVQSINFYSGTNNLTFITDNEVNFYGTSTNNGVISATTTFHTNDSEQNGTSTTNNVPLKMYFDGVDDYVSIGNISIADQEAYTLSFKVIAEDTSWSLGVGSGSGWFLHNTDRVYYRNLNGDYIFWPIGSSYSDTLIDIEISVNNNRNATVIVNGSNLGTKNIGVDSSISFSRINRVPFTNLMGVGTIYDININNVASYKGYGNSDSAWEDQIGSNDGTVLGSPITTRLGVESDGTLTRRYQTNTNTGTRDFTENNGIWIVEAVSADVDISSSTYATSTNVFRAIAGGTFTENPDIGEGEHVVPKVQITYPANGIVTELWNPSVDFDDADTCQYKYGSSGIYTTIDCANNGSDIPTPTANIETTLYVKGTYTNTSYSEQLQTFTYDNTAPSPVDCSIPLSESTREYYFLEEDIYTDCYITNDITLRGEGYTIAGSVIANASNTTDAFDIELENITIVGTTSANGISGGNGGDITIATSTTRVIESNGADGTGDGGNGGTILITNSLASPLTSTITSNGGSSTSCGNGGDAGVITLTNSAYGTITNIAGTSENSGCPGQTKQSGSRIIPTTTGTHTSQIPSSSGSSSNSTPSSSGREGFINIVNPINPFDLKPTQEFQPFNPENFIPQQVGSTVIPAPFKDFQAPGQPQFTELPRNFGLSIRDFVFEEDIPQPIEDIINSIPAVNSIIAGISSNSNKTQQLARLSFKPQLIDTTDAKGVFIIKNEEGQEIKTYLTYKDGELKQWVKVAPNKNIKIQLDPLEGGSVVGRYQGIDTEFKPNENGIPEIKLQSLSDSGQYTLSTDSTLIPLVIEVMAPNIIEVEKRKGFIPWLLGLIFG